MKNRKEKIDFLKGVLSGERDPHELKRLPEAIYKHINGFTWENVDTRERKTLTYNGEHNKAAYFFPDIYQPDGGYYIFCSCIEIAEAIKNLK